MKILGWLPTLTGCSLPSRGATVLGPCSMARALTSRPEKQVFEHRQAIFTKFGEIPQTVALFEWP